VINVKVIDKEILRNRKTNVNGKPHKGVNLAINVNVKKREPRIM